MRSLHVGQLRYGAFCDERGAMLGDGIAFRMGDEHHPSLWPLRDELVDEVRARAEQAVRPPGRRHEDDGAVAGGPERGPVVRTPGQAREQAGVAGVAALLGYEHSLVRHDDLSRVDVAFFTLNGWISVGYLAVTLAARALA